MNKNVIKTVKIMTKLSFFGFLFFLVFTNLQISTTTLKILLNILKNLENLSFAMAPGAKA